MGMVRVHWGVVRLALLAGSAVAALSLGCAAGSSAATLAATCASLQTEIDTAAKSEGADTVLLSEMCKESVKLPAYAEFTLEGAPGSTAGLDGEGLATSLVESTEAAGAITFTNLTFEHAGPETYAGGAMSLYAQALTLSHDVFEGDTAKQANASGGAVYVVIVPAGGTCNASEPAAVTVTESRFIDDGVTSKNGVIGSRGGALDAYVNCAGRASSITHSVFEGDSVATDSSTEAEGGGVAFIDPATTPGLLYQDGNVFDSDTVAGPAEGNRGGGGEWVENINLTSVGDRFSRDSIPGTTGSRWSWGGGLGILNTSCSGGTPTESTLEDAVLAGNSIGAGTPADLGGAGIYVGSGCGPDPEKHSHLRLLDSTVTENSVATAGGTAGIDGHPSDQLALENSIVASNSNGSEIHGFTGSGGSLTSTFSDVCDEAGTAPLTSELGNICAPPKLTDEGNPASYDVHETEASPTIDAGSNSLVPPTLTSDFFGGARIAASAKGLGCEIAPPVGPAVVDMGAAEYVGIVQRGPAPPCVAPRPAVSSFTFPKITQLLKGALKLSFKGIGRGKLVVTASFKITKLVTVRVHGHRRREHRTITVTFGHGGLTIAASGNHTVTLTPSRAARLLLAAHRREAVKLTVTYTATGKLKDTQARTFTDLYRLPRPKHHH